VNIFDAAACYRRAAVGSSRDEAQPSISTPQAANFFSFPLHIRRFVLLQLQHHRSAAGSDLGTKIKYLKKTTSGATGSGLATTTKYRATHNWRRRGKRPRNHA
jgi:hypothetical protein